MILGDVYIDLRKREEAPFSDNEETEMDLESRYVTFKHKDISGALDSCDLEAFEALCDKINKFRKARGAGELEGIVIEKDWPEYQPTLDLLSKRINALSD